MVDSDLLAYEACENVPLLRGSAVLKDTLVWPCNMDIGLACVSFSSVDAICRLLVRATEKYMRLVHDGARDAVRVLMAVVRQFALLSYAIGPVIDVCALVMVWQRRYNTYMHLACQRWTVNS